LKGFSSSNGKAFEQMQSEEMELTRINTSKYYEEREEVLDRILDIMSMIKKRNIQLTVDYFSIAEKLKRDFTKRSAYKLIESMKNDEQLQSHTYLHYNIKKYHTDIIQLNKMD
jgi:hypothetical protein